MQSAQFFARTVRQLMQFVLFGWVNSLKWTIGPSVPPADIRHVKSSSQLLLGKKHLPVIKESSGKVCSPQSIKLTFFQIFLWLRLRALKTSLAFSQCIERREMETGYVEHLLFSFLAWLRWEREVPITFWVLLNCFALPLLHSPLNASFSSWRLQEIVSLETSSRVSRRPFGCRISAAVIIKRYLLQQKPVISLVTGRPVKGLACFSVERKSSLQIILRNWMFDCSAFVLAQKVRGNRWLV